MVFPEWCEQSSNLVLQMLWWRNRTLQDWWQRIFNTYIVNIHTGWKARGDKSRYKQIIVSISLLLCYPCFCCGELKEEIACTPRSVNSGQNRDIFNRCQGCAMFCCAMVIVYTCTWTGLLNKLLLYRKHLIHKPEYFLLPLYTCVE